jgi:glyoxylase I family protein
MQADVSTEAPATGAATFVEGIWAVRYQARDIGRAVAFYTGRLGLKLDMQNLPAFAALSIGDFRLVLSGPGASGTRPMPDGRTQEPGGWNRIMLRVTNLPACVEALNEAGLHFRNGIEVGPGGRQIQLEDLDGNPIELFEPAP